MDGERFDRLTRVLATGTRRRSMLKGVAGALLGGVAAGRLSREAAAACSGYGRPCGTGCCTGLSCVGGRCGCAAGQQICNTNTGPICVKPCPEGQVLGSGCRCLCRDTGRPPINGLCCTPADAIPTELPCCEGLEVNDQGVCAPPPVVCAKATESCATETCCAASQPGDPVLDCQSDVCCIPDDELCIGPGDNACCSGCCNFNVNEQWVCGSC